MGQLVGKRYLFRRRILWRYPLGALLLSLARPTLLPGFGVMLLALAAGLVGPGLAVVVLRSCAQRRHSLVGALVTFRAADLEVRLADGASPETHDWQ